MASHAFSGGDEEGHSSAELSLEVVKPSGELYGTFVAPCGEKVEQFLERLGLDAAAECATLLCGDSLLPPGSALGDCGLPPGATLTLVRARQSRLQLAAFAYGHWQAPSAFSWVDRASPAAQLCSGAVAWCHNFADGCMDGACGAVCSLQDPEPLQHLVDSGEASKVEVVKAILAVFVRSLLAVGRVAARESGDSAAATEILREQLPRVARGADVLCGREPPTPEQLASLSEPYLQRAREDAPELFAQVDDRVREGLAEPLELEAQDRDELLLSIWSDEDHALIGWRQFLERHARSCECSGTARWCDECCKEGWIGFLKAVDYPGNMCFRVQNEDTFYPCTSTHLYQFAAGVYLDGEDAAPDQLPTHYVFQFAETD